MPDPCYFHHGRRSTRSHYNLLRSNSHTHLAPFFHDPRLKPLGALCLNHLYSRAGACLFQKV